MSENQTDLDAPSPDVPAPQSKGGGLGAFKFSRSTRSENGSGAMSVTITELEVPWRTIIRLLLVAALLWLFLQLWTQVFLVFIALILTLALDPHVSRLERRGWNRGRAVLAVVIAVFLVIVGLLAIIVPPLVEQGASLITSLPDYADDFTQIAERYPTVDQWIDDFSAEGGDSNALFERLTAYAPQLLSFGAGILSGAVSLFFLAVLTIYLLIDGPRLFASYVAGLDPAQRARVKTLRLELTRVVSGYILGQFLVSGCFGIFTFVTLTIIGTPEPLLIAALAAILGAIPMVGATLATIPAVLMTLTVSVPAAIIVLVVFILYQQFENNIIAPRAFRNTLKISSLAVLIAVSFGSALFGVLGAMLALPVAAALPALIRGLKEGVPIPTAPEDEALSWPAESEHAP